jgi:Rps23 Pro-64 3,4-dihydroxylase Tpa1-like proline 4-hydroxylase
MIVEPATIDREALAPWVAPCHLAPEALAAYRAAFAVHPARLVVLPRFLRDEAAERLGRFLIDECELRDTFGLYSVEPHAVSREQWLEAREADRFYRYATVSGVRPPCRLSPNAVTFVKLCAAFGAGAFTSLFEAISGLALGGSVYDAHALGQGDYLRAHSDDLRRRRLAFVLYLSSGWCPAFGGALHVRDPATRVEAEFNSLVLFDVTRGGEHFIAPIEPVAGDRRRLTFGGWVHHPPPPAP